MPLSVDLQKAGIWKRCAAWMLDIILVLVVAVGIGALLSNLLHYEQDSQKYQAKYEFYEKKYKLDEIDFSKNQLTEEEQQRVNAADADIRQDKESTRLYSLLVNKSILIVTFSLLISYILLEFVVPILLGSGQTISKKAFSVGLIRVDSVKVSNLQLFVRAVLGKFTIETMIPVYVVLMFLFGRMSLTGMVLLVGLAIGQLVCLAVTSNNSAIHDMISGTVVVDISSQQVFKDSQELIAYTKRIHAERAARGDY